jgi:hypothetical protein
MFLYTQRSCCVTLLILQNEYMGSDSIFFLTWRQKRAGLIRTSVVKTQLFTTCLQQARKPFTSPKILIAGYQHTILYAFFHRSLCKIDIFPSGSQDGREDKCDALPPLGGLYRVQWTCTRIYKIDDEVMLISVGHSFQKGSKITPLLNKQ